MAKHGRRQRVYDHRLRGLVRETGDARIATDRGVPRSTATGWLRMEPVEAVTLDLFEVGETELRAEVMKLRWRVRRLQAVVGVLVALVRACGARAHGVQRLNDSSKEVLVLCQNSDGGNSSYSAMFLSLYRCELERSPRHGLSAFPGSHGFGGRHRFVAQLLASTFSTEPYGHPDLPENSRGVPGLRRAARLGRRET